MVELIYDFLFVGAMNADIATGRRHFLLERWDEYFNQQN